jgi:7-carboxy-7-deazaguanine synthase
MLTTAERNASPAQRIEPLRILQSVQSDEHLVVHEVYRSIQGESTWAGVPCVFVRTTGCHLRCTYCDTAHAFYDGKMRSVDDVLAEVVGMSDGALVEITGGEPLLQRGTKTLIDRLHARGRTVLVETSGAVSLHDVSPHARYIVDVKTPSSGEDARNHAASWRLLRPGVDEVKFVISDVFDYEFARALVVRSAFPTGVTVLFSPAAPRMNPTELAERIIKDALAVRFQVQMHKVLWGDKSGV